MLVDVVMLGARPTEPAEVLVNSVSVLRKSERKSRVRTSESVARDAVDGRDRISRGIGLRRRKGSFWVQHHLLPVETRRLRAE